MIRWLVVFRVTSSGRPLSNHACTAARARRPTGTSRVLFPFPVTRMNPSSMES